MSEELQAKIEALEADLKKQVRYSMQQDAKIVRLNRLLDFIKDAIEGESSRK